MDIIIGNNTYNVIIPSTYEPEGGIPDISEMTEIAKILDISIFPGESGLPEDTVMVKFDKTGKIIAEVSRV